MPDMERRREERDDATRRLRQARLAAILALAVAAIALLTAQRAPAKAEEPRGVSAEEPAGDGLYGGLSAGFALPENWEIRLDGEPGNLEFDGGFAAQGALGYRITPKVRTELELGYIGAEVDRLMLPGGPERADGDISTVSIMANAVAVPWEAGTVRPYAGVGIGAGRVSADARLGARPAGEVVRFEEAKAGFAYQGFIGLQADLINGGEGSVGYRYFSTVGIDTEMDMFRAEMDATVHVVQAGVSFPL
jgi:opacity protein-like surface antigen